ncbi:MAG TPA: hypothetical protein VKH37_12460 [Ferruginibacter sp.]|nr:hypothetical protein [Ferruginibacter sp.]
MRIFIILLFCCIALHVQSQNNLYLKVHFLYGSKPSTKYKDTERKWFGGVLGGHVGIEGDSGKVLNFVSGGVCHLFAEKQNRKSHFKEHRPDDFYAIFGGDPDSMKKTVVYVPITVQQKQRFDSIAAIYLQQTPYDYAVFGMRCGAAAYDILGKLDIFPQYSNTKTYKKIFYPKQLRKRLLKKAQENGWLVVKEEGTGRRRWERD